MKHNSSMMFMALSGPTKTPIFTPSFVVRTIILLVCLGFDVFQKTPTALTVAALFYFGPGFSEAFHSNSVGPPRAPSC